MTGVVIHLGRAYTDEAPNVQDPSDLSSLHILGRGLWDGFRAKLLYMKPVDLRVGTSVLMGQPIGLVEDRAALARHRDPDRGPMGNHVHLTLYHSENGADWRVIDPTPLLDVEGKLNVGRTAGSSVCCR